MDAQSGPFDEFAIATAVLTRLPVGAALPADGAIAASGWAFPLVGAGIGAIAALAFLVAELLGSGSAPAALLAVAAGLADTAAGFGGGKSREEKLAIMRDSQHGTFGIVALVLSIGLRGAALGTIGEPIRTGLALIAAHAASRGAL